MINPKELVFEYVKHVTITGDEAEQIARRYVMYALQELWRF